MGRGKTFAGPSITPILFIYIHFEQCSKYAKLAHTRTHTLHSHTHTHNQAAADFWHRLAVFQENAGKSAGYVAENPKMLSVAKSIWCHLLKRFMALSVCASVSASAPVSECIKYVYVMENFPREIFGKVRLLWRSETWTVVLAAAHPAGWFSWAHFIVPLYCVAKLPTSFPWSLIF